MNWLDWMAVTAVLTQWGVSVNSAGRSPAPFSRIVLPVPDRTSENLASRPQHCWNSRVRFDGCLEQAIAILVLKSQPRRTIGLQPEENPGPLVGIK